MEALDHILCVHSFDIKTPAPMYCTSVSEIFSFTSCGLRK